MLLLHFIVQNCINDEYVILYNFMRNMMINKKREIYRNEILSNRLPELSYNFELHEFKTRKKTKKPFVMQIFMQDKKFSVDHILVRRLIGKNTKLFYHLLNDNAGRYMSTFQAEIFNEKYEKISPFFYRKEIAGCPEKERVLLQLEERFNTLMHIFSKVDILTIDGKDFNWNDVRTIFKEHIDYYTRDYKLFKIFEEDNISFIAEVGDEKFFIPNISCFDTKNFTSFPAFMNTLIEYEYYLDKKERTQQEVQKRTIEKMKKYF